MTVVVTPNGSNQYQFTVHATVEAPEAAVYDVLTDYNHHNKILPYISKSQIIQKMETGHLVEQEAGFHALFWTYSMHITEQIKETPPHKIEFHAIAGDLNHLEGSCQLVAESSTSQLACQFIVQPKRHIPEWAVRLIARHFLVKMMQSLAEHATTGLRTEQ